MKIRVTVISNAAGEVLASEIFDVSEHGDVERAVSKVLADARTHRSHSLWNFTVQVSKAEP
jgi:hypothetical protein